MLDGWMFDGVEVEIDVEPKCRGDFVMLRRD
jgi:hypothetical protein